MWSRIVGMVLVLYAGYVTYRGRISLSDDNYNTRYVNRSEKPVQFWLLVLAILALAMALLLNVFHF